jgi:hypothetical protein
MPYETANSADGIETIEKQLRLSRELKQELVASRAAYAARDLDAIYHHIGALALLCMQLQQSGELTRAGQTASLNQIFPVSCGSQAGSRQQELLVQLAAAGQEIRELNRELLVLVKGSLRTFKMIANAMAGFSPTYGRPAMQSSPAELQARS